MAKLHHIGFLVDDMEAETARVEANGAVHHGGIIDSDKGTETECKFLDPNGQVFGLTGHAYARDVWRIAV